MNIIQIFGITNVIFLFLVLLSCRCMGSWGLVKFQNEKYMKFYNLHCYFWYGLIISVVAHAVFAFMR